MAGPPARSPLPDDVLAHLLDDGARLFDAGRHWHAHEAWEAAWHGARGPERDLFQGLIHATAALVHHAAGNAEGYRLQTTKMQRRLAGHGTWRGIDTGRLMRDILALPPPGTPTAYPRLPRQTQDQE